MAERKAYSTQLVEVGKLLEAKRKNLGSKYASRDKFIELRSLEIFDGVPWISHRHLSNIELGKNWISIELLRKHAQALEIDPIELFGEIMEVCSQCSLLDDEHHTALKAMVNKHRPAS